MSPIFPFKTAEPVLSSSITSFVGETNRVEGIVSDGAVAWGPFRFKALHLPSKTKACVVFRPHDVYVTTAREEGGWPGQIVNIQFMGATESLLIDMGGGQTLSAALPKGVGKLSGFKKGQTVYVLVPLVHIFEIADDFQI